MMLLKTLNSNSPEELRARLSLYVRQSPRQSSGLLLFLILLIYGLMLSFSLIEIHPRYADQKVYDLVSDENDFQFLDEIDPDTSLQSKGYYLTIDQAHRQGKFHMGAWIHLTDSSGDKVLLLKRGPNLVTCPNSWGLIGEHTQRDETPLETVQRALVEEVWGGSNATYEDIRWIQNLTEFPVYYYRDYGDRVDRQLTYVYDVRMKEPAKDIFLKLDDEVADYQWISLDDYKKWMVDDAAQGHKYFCHTSITELSLLALKQLMLLNRRRNGGATRDEKR